MHVRNGRNQSLCSTGAAGSAVASPRTSATCMPEFAKTMYESLSESRPAAAESVDSVGSMEFMVLIGMTLGLPDATSLCKTLCKLEVFQDRQNKKNLIRLSLIELTQLP